MLRATNGEKLWMARRLLAALFVLLRVIVLVIAKDVPIPLCVLAGLG